MKQTKFLVLAFASLLAGAAVFADEAYDIIKKSSTLPVPDFSETTLEMDLIEKDGTVSEHRVIQQFGRRNNGLVETIFAFKSPAAIKDTRILKAEKAGKDDDQWIYLPSLRTTRRIAMAERQKSFVGSDFTYDDMALRKVDDDDQAMMNENVSKTIGGTTYNCWQIKSTAKQKKGEFSYRVQYIDKDTYLPVQIDYFDKKGEPLKTYTIEKIVRTTDPRSKNQLLIRWENRVVNAKTGHSTTVKLAKQSFEKEQPARLFTQGWLNTGK